MPCVPHLRTAARSFAPGRMNAQCGRHVAVDQGGLSSDAACAAIMMMIMMVGSFCERAAFRACEMLGCVIVGTGVESRDWYLA